MPKKACPRCKHINVKSQYKLICEECGTALKTVKSEENQTESIATPVQIGNKETKEPYYGFSKFTLGFFILLFIGAAYSLIEPKRSDKQPSVQIKASVYFDENLIIVTNDDNFDWSDVELGINLGAQGRSDRGYLYKIPKLAYRETRIIDLMQFARTDGTRFNPFTTKFMKIYIACATSQGHGFWTGGKE